MLRPKTLEHDRRQILTHEFIDKRSSTRQTRARYAWTLALLPLLFTHIVQAQTATATIPTGADPFAVVVNPVTNTTYVANRNGNTVTVIDGATNNTTTLIAGANPTAVAVNPITNKIYVANFGSANVTVIDGATNTTENIDTGVWPFAVAVNPVTNKAYVVNYGTNNITVIDGATNATATMPVPSGNGLFYIAVNPVTNKIYVSNYDGASVTVIDGVTNNTTTVATGSQPFFLAVNPVTNKIYVPNNSSKTVTVIDGATNKTTTLAAGSGPFAAAVNPVTNKIYISNEYSGNVTVIDGATNDTTTVATGGFPQFVSVNPVTNKIYVAGGGMGATAIDGATNTVSTVEAGSEPFSLAVNPVTNKIYVGNEESNNVTVVDGATNNTVTVAAGTNPYSVAVNPVTNKIYVSNLGDDTVAVIDGVTNNTTTVAAGLRPISVVVNPVTNKIYVANQVSNSVTVIDGATNSTTTVAAGLSPDYMAVNPATNKIYVGNQDSKNVTVIDGGTNTTTAVTTGTTPYSVAVNSVTNKIYVANASSSTVTVIDGSTNSTATVAVGSSPESMALNPVTNKIYVGNLGSNNVTVIDGASNTSTTIAAGLYAAVLAVNPVTNKIYAASPNNSSVTVIDGVTNNTTTVAVGAHCFALAVNPATNKIYVGYEYNSSVTVIDGATNTTTTVPAGSEPIALAVNPVTNQVYAANYDSNNVTVITEANTQAVPLTTTITPLTNNQSSIPVPGFTFTATGTTITQPDALFYQFDTWQSPWLAGSGSNPTFTGSAATLQPGFHILYAYATDGQEATSTQSSPQIGNIQAYGFLVLPTAPTNISANAGTTPQSAIVNLPFANNLAVTVTDASNNPVAGVAVTFTAPSTGASGIFSNGANTIAVQTNTSGVATARFTANANSGGPYNVTASAGNASTSFLLTNSPLYVPTGPLISNIQAVTIGGNSALITWTTDQPSTSQVNYGPNSFYGSSSPLDNNLVTNHAVTLTNLSPDATYNFDVVSTNSAKGMAFSNNATFNASPYVGYLAFWGITANGVTISWSTDAPATTFVAYGTTSALGQSSPIQTALSSSHGVVLTGLNPGTTYYFRAESTTASGSTGASNLYTFTTGGAPSSPAPVITNVTVTNITTTSATITWTTDQYSTTQVNYGTTTAYGSSSPLDSGLVTSHSVILTGLTPGTTYDLDAISANSSGTSGASSNSTFQTAALASAPPAITNIQTTVTSTTATITWTTDQAANSAVNYGSISTTPDSNYVTSHSVTLTGLIPASSYSFSVVSTSATGKTTTSPTRNFTTAAATATAPYVGYVAFWGVNNSGVTISWSTDMPANTELAYGTSPSLGQLTPAQGALTNNHGVVLTGLASGTTYYFVAQSTAANGSTGYSTTYSFTTTGSPAAPAPVISNIQTTVTTTTVTITWTTDEVASSQVNYGVTTDYSASALDPALTTNHSMTFTSLLPGTTYNFDVVSSNVNGVSSTSSNSSFQTTGGAPGPVITNVAASSITSSTALITWTTDQAATSVVRHGTTTTSDPTLVTSHSVTLIGLTPNTTYTYVVSSANVEGVLTNSPSLYTFTTTAPSATAPVISYVGYWGITSSGITISWSTDLPSTTAVAYGTTTPLTSVTPVQTALTSSHGVTLTGLQPNTTYYFQPQSADVDGNTGYSATIYTFTTLAGAPAITNAVPTPSTGNTATITWTTSVPTYSYVQYGPSAGNYNRYSAQTTLTTTPSCTLGYVPSGTTHYQLVSTDANGNQIVSPDATFVEP